MSQWVDRVRSHAIWGLLTSIGPSIDQGLTRDPIDSESIDSLERLRVVIAFSGKRLAGTDPVLILPSVLEALSATLTQLKSYLDTFVLTGDVTQLSAANSQADVVLNSLSLILSPPTADELTSLSELAGEYRKTLEKNLKQTLTIQNNVVTKYAEIESKAIAIETALTTEYQRLAAIVTEQQSAFSSAQDKRATEFSALQADLLAKYTAASNEQQTTFSTDQDTRRTAFSEMLRTNKEAISEVIDEYTVALNSHEKEYAEKEKIASDLHIENIGILKTQFEDSASEILQEMRRHKSEIESLVGVIGNLGVTSGYKKIANQARYSMWIWQAVTVLALVGLIAVAYKLAFPPSSLTYETNPVALLDSLPADKEHSNKLTETQKSQPVASTPQVISDTSESAFFHGLATRIFLSITFGIFAAYAGRQASLSYNTEQRNRKLALELEALGPFIEPLDKTDRDKFRVQVGDRSFGVPDENNKPREEDPVTALGWLKSKEVQDALVDKVKEIIKGLK